MEESTIVRENLMTEPNYRPYCGRMYCTRNMPRINWDEEINQFKCKCGYVTSFPTDFINRYKTKWNLKQ